MSKTTVLNRRVEQCARGGGMASGGLLDVMTGLN